MSANLRECFSCHETILVTALGRRVDWEMPLRLPLVDHRCSDAEAQAAVEAAERLLAR